MIKYNVYIQNKPILNKKTREFSANLELLGQVEANNYSHAFLLAKRYCEHPVLEKVMDEKIEEQLRRHQESQFINDLIKRTYAR